jgi:hypothetical protein
MRQPPDRSAASRWAIRTKRQVIVYREVARRLLARVAEKYFVMERAVLRWFMRGIAVVSGEPSKLPRPRLLHRLPP